MGLICLARRGRGVTLMLEEISQEEGIPASFLGKILQNLTKAGLIRSVRGNGGGFTLARNAEEISLLEVFEAIEGKMALQRCLQSPSSCERTDSCALCGVFEQAQDQVKDVFGRTTIADLLAKHKPLNPPAGRVAATPVGVMSDDAGH